MFVGAGVLAMPAAISHMGLTLGIIIIIFAGFTSALGLYLLAQCSKFVQPGEASFFSVAKRTYPHTAILFDFAIMLKTFGMLIERSFFLLHLKNNGDQDQYTNKSIGVGVSYLIIVGDLMPQILATFTGDYTMDFLLDRRFWITVSM